MLSKIASGIGYYENLLILVINAAATATAALIGAFFPRGTANLRFLEIWMASGAVASMIPLAIDMGNFFWVGFVAFLWGATLGFGMPASMEYLTEGTAVENRGRVSAIVFFAIFVGIFISAMIIEPLDYRTQFGTLGALRFVGLIVFILLNPVERSAVKKTSSYMTIIRKRSFFLYFSAWIMFALVNYLSVPILNSHFGESFVNASATIETIFTAVFALVGGVLCDTVGRKVVVISGFIMLGLGYAVLGIFSLSFIGWSFYTVVDGIAWGMLGVVFFMTLWGDLAYENSSKKYYALGGIPLLFSNLLQKLVGPDIVASVSVTAVFSVASLFLFLAILPLLYAPETLPEKNLKERELKGYIEKAKKTKEKYA
ncbi:MAG: MFS transporter [Candidatus Bathyarchaeia archaeon]